MNLTLTSIGRYVLPLSAAFLAPLGGLFAIEQIGKGESVFNFLLLSFLLILGGLAGFNSIISFEERLKAEKELERQKKNVDDLENILRDMSHQGSLPKSFRDRWFNLEIHPKIR